MILVLAKDALKKKVTFETAVITGNYECSYALGLLTGVTGNNEQKEYCDIIQLREKTIEMLDGYEPPEEKWRRLIEMVKAHEPSSKVDEQMIELYHMGIEEFKFF